MNHRSAIPKRQDQNTATTYTDELTQRAQRAGVDAWTTAAARLCGLALDAGLVTVTDLQTAVDGCRTRGEVTPFLRQLAADVMLAHCAKGWQP